MIEFGTAWLEAHEQDWWALKQGTVHDKVTPIMKADVVVAIEVVGFPQDSSIGIFSWDGSKRN